MALWSYKRREADNGIGGRPDSMPASDQLHMLVTTTVVFVHLYPSSLISEKISELNGGKRTYIFIDWYLHWLLLYQSSRDDLRRSCVERAWPNGKRKAWLRRIFSRLSDVPIVRMFQWENASVLFASRGRRLPARLAMSLDRFYCKDWYHITVSISSIHIMLMKLLFIFIASDHAHYTQWMHDRV